VALRPDVLVAVADDAVRAAKTATASIPIVMAIVDARSGTCWVCLQASRDRAQRNWIHGSG